MTKSDLEEILKKLGLNIVQFVRAKEQIEGLINQRVIEAKLDEIEIAYKMLKGGDDPAGIKTFEYLKIRLQELEAKK